MLHAVVMLFLYLLLGASAGIIFGILGVGGGLLVVPGLAWIFQFEQFPANNIMHIAVGTSLAIMVVSTIRAIYAHRRYKTKFWDIYRRLLSGVIIGVIGGAVIGHFLQSRIIAIIFGAFLLMMAIQMFFMQSVNPARQLPGNKELALVGGFAGVMAGLLGLGGGVVTIPYLTHCNVPMRESVLVSIATGLTVSVVGTITVIITGLYVPNLPPWSTGYVYWPAWFCVSMGTLFFVPLGVRLSYRLPVPILKRIFAVFLLFIAINLLIRY